MKCIETRYRKIRQKIIKLFKDNGLQLVTNDNGLQITIDANLIETDCLDVTLNLNSRKYWPYRKSNNPSL